VFSPLFVFSMTLIALIYTDEFGCTTGGGFLVWIWIMMTTWFCFVHRSWALLCCPSRSGVSTLLVWESIHIASRFASGKFFELCTSLSSHLLYMLKWWRTRSCFCEEVVGWVGEWWLLQWLALQNTNMSSFMRFEDWVILMIYTLPWSYCLCRWVLS
jgi:hypothetical protein